MIALVGYTGFVESNIYAAGKVDKVFNSQNIEEAYGLCPELLIYAGLRAEKFLANTMPQKDMELIVQAQENIRKIAPKKLVLISTIDVFKNPLQVDEKSEIDCEDLHAYGYNRYRLECWVRENYPDALIIRLPGLFGINLKKNFIYDFIHVIPSLLKKDKFEELAEKDRDITDFYELQDNGFYKCRVLDKTEEAELKGKFKKLGFTALNFTDSRNVYQFYPLDRLWDDIQRALRAGLLLWHPATEPVLVSELYRALTGTDFVNELPGKPVYYDYRTIYAEIFGGKDGYISTGGQITDKIVEFVRGQE